MKGEGGRLPLGKIIVKTRREVLRATKGKNKPGRISESKRERERTGWRGKSERVHRRRGVRGGTRRTPVLFHAPFRAENYSGACDSLWKCILSDSERTADDTPDCIPPAHLLCHIVHLCHHSYPLNLTSLFFFHNISALTCVVSMWLFWRLIVLRFSSYFYAWTYTRCRNIIGFFRSLKFSDKNYWKCFYKVFKNCSSFFFFCTFTLCSFIYIYI